MPPADPATPLESTPLPAPAALGRWALVPAPVLVLSGAALLALGACMAVCFLFDAAWLHARHAELLALQARGPWLFGLGFFAAFTLLSALALPGCGVLALMAGASFGWLGGTMVVALASTLGATLSFLAARHLWRDRVRQRFGERLHAVEQGLAKDGAFYVFMLRMLPVIPFPVFNPLMGLSSMPVARYAAASLLGMTAGSAALVYAGVALAGAGSAAGAPPMSLWAALAALGLLPLLLRAWWRRRQAGA